MYASVSRPKFHLEQNMYHWHYIHSFDKVVIAIVLEISYIYKCSWSSSRTNVTVAVFQVPVITISVYTIFSQHKSSNLCEACHLEIAKRTLQRHDVILTLRQVGRGFCAYLSNNIVSRAMRQRIDKAVTDDEALGYIRDVCLIDTDFRHNIIISYP